MDKLSDAIISFIINSIPEETYLTVFTLILLRAFDFLKLKKRSNIFRILIPIVGSASISTVLRYKQVPLDTSSTILLATMVLFICIAYKYYSIKNIFLVLICTMASVASLLIIENLYIPIVLYVTGKTIQYINQFPIYTFLLALPERVIEYSLITYIMVRKFNFYKVKLIKTIISNKIYAVAATIILVVNLGVLIGMTKLIGFDKILDSIPFATQLFIILATLMFPILNMVAFASVIYYNKSRQMVDEYLNKKRINMAIDSVIFNICNSDQKCDKIELLENLKQDINKEAG